MKLDATDLRYITADEFRVLTAVEIGSKNHEVVPSALITEISCIRGGGVNKLMGQLAKRGLIAKVQNTKYDGYRLTYGGLDYLALRTFAKRSPSSVYSVGNQVGVGKESDILVVADEQEEQRILKIHRLGRISFRAIKSKRDYLGKRKSASWMYMSRLSAQKEWAFMKILYQHGFPVPVPIDQARHCIVMSFIDSYPLRQVSHVASPGTLYSKLMELIVRLARSGLIHGDFNEFNILIRVEDDEPVVIDFPQMVSIRHENAEYFFDRDVKCIRKFFKKRFRFESREWPTFQEVMEEEAGFAAEEKEWLAEQKAAEERAAERAEAVAEGREVPAVEEVEVETSTRERPVRPLRLDKEVEASGFGRHMQKELEDYMAEIQEYEDDDDDDEDGIEEEDEEDEEEEEEAVVEPQSTDASHRDDAAIEKEVSERLAKLELEKNHQRKLGNDIEEVEPESSTRRVLFASESESDSLSEDNSDGSDGDAGSAYPQSDFTSYVPRNRAARRQQAGPPARAPVKDSEALRSIVFADMTRKKEQTERKHHARKAPGKVGNEKGKKWKKSSKVLVNKSAGGDGW